MDLEKRIEFFSGMLLNIRTLTAGHVSTFVKPENLETYLAEVEAQFTTFQDQLAALAKDCREKLSGIHEDIFAKLQINYKTALEAQQQARKKSKGMEECEKALQNVREKIYYNNVQSRKRGDKEYEELKRHFDINCNKIFQSYHKAILRIGKKYI
jgi:hypothetical protein